MRREYSLKSLVFSKFPFCYETLSKSVKFNEVKIRKGVLMEVMKGDPLEILKDIDYKDLPIYIVFLREASVAYIEFFATDTVLNVMINGFEEKKSDELFQLVEESLCLTAPTEEDIRKEATFPRLNDLLWKIFDRVEQVAKRLDTIESRSLKKVRCFVSFRFDDHSKALAFELREFMELVGIEFVSGLGYEPRSLSAKVVERLSEPLDLFLVIFSSSGDSAWLNQEIGVARARNLPIIVLKEESSDVNPGMIGDTEYLLFPNNSISKTFVGILQALSFLKTKTGED